MNKQDHESLLFDVPLLFERRPLDFLYVAAIKQFFPLSDNWSLFWGLSAAFGPNNTGRENRSEVYGIDLYLKWKPVTSQSHHVVVLQTEWFYRRRQIPLDVLQDVSGYVYFLWRFSQRWATALRYEFGTPSYDQEGKITIDSLDSFWTDHRHRVSYNITFWPTEFSRFRLQGSVDIPQWRDEPIWAGVLAAEFLIGAHGTHDY